VTWAALALVVVAAFVHAGWNYVLKKSGGGIGLLTASSAFAALAWAPIVAVFVLIQGYRFEPVHLLFMLGSAVVHTAYYLLLDRAYRSGGDLSIVYPLARATGPLLTIVVAVLLLGERPGAFAIAGALLIGASALLLTGNPLAWHRSGARHAIGFALLTGLTIAAYTVWDKAAVAMWLIPPLVYDWGCIAIRLAMSTRM
jgi:drug/metabolite transporter (DMT)-like permease